MTQTLSTEQKKTLMRQAHTLQPVVRIGNKGLTEAVHIEIERALEAHQLIKIKIVANDRRQRQEILAAIGEHHQATLVHAIGFIGIFYRPSDDD